MTDKVQMVANIVARHMDDIKAMFKPGVKITVMVRTPDNPKADFCLSSDDLAEVGAMVTRLLAVKKEEVQ